MKGPTGPPGAAGREPAGTASRRPAAPGSFEARIRDPSSAGGPAIAASRPISPRIGEIATHDSAASPGWASRDDPAAGRSGSGRTSGGAAPHASSDR
jgi:hypothetical protein